MSVPFQLCQPTQKEKFNMPGLIDRSKPTAIVPSEPKPEAKSEAPVSSTGKPRGRPRKVIEPPAEGEEATVSTSKSKKKLDVSKSKVY
jgi:hypothetical protein